MRIVIPGGSGQVGMVLARAFLADGHDVVILTRSGRNDRAAGQDDRAAGQDGRDAGQNGRNVTASASRPDASLVKPGARIVAWDGRTIGAWAEHLEGADVVINLAGRSVNCRYTPAHRREIMDSRVDSTNAVGRAIAACAHPPRVWLQASTATIYAHRFDAPNDEATGIVGNASGEPEAWRFSIDVATAWERTAVDLASERTRLVLLRSAMIMSPDRGGIFDTLRRLAQLGLGGPAAGGRQFVSWIHEIDFIRSLYWLMEHDSLRGAVNIASPTPLPYREFMRALREAVGMPIGLPATKWMLAIGAWIMRSETELVLKSRRVVPRRLLESGFEFRFPEWRQAVRELTRRE